MLWPPAGPRTYKLCFLLHIQLLVFLALYATIQLASCFLNWYYPFISYGKCEQANNSSSLPGNNDKCQSCKFFLCKNSAFIFWFLYVCAQCVHFTAMLSEGLGQLDSIDVAVNRYCMRAWLAANRQFGLHPSTSDYHIHYI
jgi:hypothetical protein